MGEVVEISGTMKRAQLWGKTQTTQELLRIAHRKLKACWRKKGG